MSNNLTHKEKEIISEIHRFCENDCGIRGNCAEDDCCLFRIEKIIIGKEHY